MIPNLLTLRFSSHEPCGHDDQLVLKFEKLQSIDGPHYDFDGRLTVERSGKAFISLEFACKQAHLAEFAKDLRKMHAGSLGTARLEFLKFEVAVVALGNPPEVFPVICTIGGNEQRDNCILRGFSLDRVSLMQTIRTIQPFLNQCHSEDDS